MFNSPSHLRYGNLCRAYDHHCSAGMQELCKWNSLSLLITRQISSFLERKIWNPLAYVAKQVKEIKGLRTALSCQCSISAYVVHFFLGNNYSRGLKFLQVIYENFNCDLTHGFLFRISINIFYKMTNFLLWFNTLFFFIHDINKCRFL